MDNYIGKWYRQTDGETLNIIDDNGKIKIKMSIEASGCFNFEVNCCYWKDAKLCYEINDEVFRRIYKVEKQNEKLIGSYTQRGNLVQIEYIRLSAIPEDSAFYMAPGQHIVPALDRPRLEILRCFARYGTDNSRVYPKDVFVLYETLPDVLRQYGYDRYVGNYSGPCDELAFSLLDFVCDHFRHNGNSGIPRERKAEDILDYLQKNGNTINCRGLAILLSNLLRMNGVRAVHVTCCPYEEPADDCHVVVDCRLPTGQRVVMDPSFRLYLKDSKGKYISLRALRGRIIRGEPLFHNENASYNGGPFDAAAYREYMTKNTVRFSKPLRHYNGCEEGQDGRLELIPVGYPTDGFDEKRKNEFVYDDEKFWG